MKKRNKKWADEKEFLRLKRDLQKNRESQSNLGWVELEKPIFIGWNAKLEPREDIKFKTIRSLKPVYKNFQSIQIKTIDRIKKSNLFSVV